MKYSFALTIIVFFLSTVLFAQVSTNPPQNERPANRERGRFAPNFFPFKSKRTREQEKRLRPNPEDLTANADFLKKSHTGIFRLLNDAGCDSNVYVIRVDENCQNAIPGSSFYSFREKEYTTAYLADIRLRDGLLITDGLLSQNILVKLGDVPLENLTVGSQGMRFLNEFVPEQINTTATKQYIDIVKGIRADRYEYRKVLPAAANQTYAMRVVAYRGSFYRTFRGWIFDLIGGDDRFDLTLGFRVLRKDTDGVTILWKELDRKKSPKLKYERNDDNIKLRTYVPDRSVADN